MLAGCYVPSRAERGPVHKMTIDELIESFAFLDDWMEKYRLIMELGKTLPEMSAALKVPENKVLGCQSQVWLVGGPRGLDGQVVEGRAGASPSVVMEGRAGASPSVVMEFVADSDAHIVRGLVAIALMVFAGKSPEEITSIDPRPIFHELGLDQHLSQGRSNGLLSMVGRIKEIAAAYAG